MQIQHIYLFIYHNFFHSSLFNIIIHSVDSNPVVLLQFHSFFGAESCVGKNINYRLELAHCNV